jgi:hypothetical protein
MLLSTEAFGPTLAEELALSSGKPLAVGIASWLGRGLN